MAADTWNELTSNMTLLRWIRPRPSRLRARACSTRAEFYSTIRRRLRPGGMLQQWLPRGDAVVQAAVARALQQRFPYVRVFHSLDNMGFHFLASEHPIVNRTAQELVDRMPNSATQDLIEWGSATNPAVSFLSFLVGNSRLNR